jgi:hypothetical protein
MEPAASPLGPTDHEHPAGASVADSTVALVPLMDLFQTFRPAEVIGHERIAH